MTASRPPTPHTADTPLTGARAPGADRLRWIGLALVLGSLITRATVPTTTLPSWDLDPTYYPITTPALGPAGSMLIDAITLIGAALLLVAESLVRRRIHPLWLLGAAAGSTSALLHGWWWQAIGSAAAHGTLGNQRIGLAWTAGIWAAVAVLHAAREPLLRRVLAGVLLGLVALLSLRGAQQVFVDHPMTVAAFNVDRDRFLAARGWSPDSPMALAYIRRMTQPEATGWFGLSNVVASFAGFGVAVAGAWLCSVLRARRERLASNAQLLAASAACVAAVATVYFAGSKGGYAMAMIASLLVFIGLLARRQTHLVRLAPALGPLCIFGVLAVVVLRGFIGERLGELSILFRWFYIQGASRIFASHPLSGVGPDGFQLAYLTAKNPLNPEEVTSPHSILLDWISTLGVAGLAWGAMLVVLSLLAARALTSPDEPRAPSREFLRPARQFGMLSLAGSTIAASWIESPYITPDSAVVRVLGLVVGCGLVHAVLAAPSDRALRIGLAGGGLAMLAHGQIELTASHFSSAGLFLVAIATAAAGGTPTRPGAFETASRPTRPRATGVIGAVVCSLIAGLAVTGGAIPARAWENELRQAAATVTPLADIIERFNTMNNQASRGPREDPARFFADLSKLLGRPVPQTREGWAAAGIALDAKFLPLAAALLERAQARYPDEWRVGRETGRLYLRLLEPVRTDPVRSKNLAERAAAAIPVCGPLADCERAARNAPRTRAIATVHEAIAANRAGPELELAATNLKQAHKFDPFNLDIAVKLFRLSRTLGRADEARDWASKALELDAFCRLDRATRGLSPADRAEVQAAANPGPGRPPP